MLRGVCVKIHTCSGCSVAYKDLDLIHSQSSRCIQHFIATYGGRTPIGFFGAVTRDKCDFTRLPLEY